jgi:cell wall-associated NlpC family hydrolase
MAMSRSAKFWLIGILCAAIVGIPALLVGCATLLVGGGSANCAYGASAGISYNGEISSRVGQYLFPQDKENLQEAILAGATASNVQPDFEAAIYYIENFQGHDSGGDDTTGRPVGDGLWRDPPPPYGSGPAWATSSTGAEGPFQFEYYTWPEYGVGSPLDLKEAALAAGKLLAANGAENTTNRTKLRLAAQQYNGAGPAAVNYGYDVLSVYEHLSGGGQTSLKGSEEICASNSVSVNCSLGSGQPHQVSGTAAILCEAEKYRGIYYLWGGAHQGYSLFRQQCPESSIAGSRASSTPDDPGPCATDCSGLVSVAVDYVYHQNFDWVVDDSGIMDGSPSGYWQKISWSQAQPGDIVTKTGHVEIVISYNSKNNVLDTFGSHAPGIRTGPATSIAGEYFTAIWRYDPTGGVSAPHKSQGGNREQKAKHSKNHG